MVTRLMKEFKEIEEYAKKNDIPIMEKEGITFLINTCIENKCTSCLEIGSAIGYSALMLVNNINDFYVETIELNKDRYLQAIKNIEDTNSKNKITIHHGDALEYPISNFVKHDFDCLFIDAAKAQYQKFFEKYMPLINENGICIVDNLDFHGMIYDIDHIKNRNTKQLVKKIKRFRDWIFNHDAYDVTYYAIGDGVCIIRRK
ncbi:MAG: O-methyltransferase [Coprobacillaceae bacterium]